MEIWLLGTALAFTLLGWWMGRNSGVQLGIAQTLQVLIDMKLIKLVRDENGEEDIVAYNENL